jgi:hypothetical protein
MDLDNGSIHTPHTMTDFSIVETSAAHLIASGIVSTSVPADGPRLARSIN